MLNKRRFGVILAVCVFLSLTSLVGAQDYDVPVEYATLAEYAAQTGKAITDFSEAPDLATKVAAGELPPVEERLPVEPKVVQPVETIGQYGGTLRRAWTGPSDRWNIRHLIGESFITTTVDAVPIPNVAKGYEIRDDYRTFVFYMREGMRWSDGHPVTAEDAEFWWDIKTDPELYHPHSDWMLQNGEAGKLAIIVNTFQISFPEPHRNFWCSRRREARMLAPNII